MERGTVKKRIFLSNAMMVLVTLLIFLLINLFAVKIYSETIEEKFRISMSELVNEEGMEELWEEWTFRRNEFILILGADGILCIAALVLISQIFTKNLTDHIMEPLNALADGAKRIRDNDLTQDIEYVGEIEFENVCASFNEMQASILTEQEKNRRYEKARTDMIAGISHDLRTPLTAIRGTIKGLIDGVASKPEQQKKFLETAYRRTGDMDLLLNQLFYLSKMETGNMPISLHEIEISIFLQNYAKAKQEYMESEKEQIKVDTRGITAKVSVDPEQFQRILDNLLENSRKYGGKIPLMIEISLRKTPKGVSVCFKDNGAGVPEEKLPHIFEEFYRGDESRNRKEGNGLGLYIVKYLMEAMGGSARAENADGLAVYLELAIPVRTEGAEKDGGQETNFDRRG
ncbi:MAG: HAMP domain-containing sensor histidine kinase [Eubacteriales bacterium]|nr:HAMP domain-containing sensor histidine kinase [Eubacteriales bacterium]